MKGSRVKDKILTDAGFRYSIDNMTYMNREVGIVLSSEFVGYAEIDDLYLMTKLFNKEKDKDDE